MIHGIYDLALKENDYPTQVMLQWFINEQVEEEKNASFVVDQLTRIEERGSALLFLDKQLGKRGAESE
jgi:ferritin